jgi:hypothetical protein
MDFRKVSRWLSIQAKIRRNNNYFFSKVISDEELVRKWDASYKVRSRKYGAFLACKADYLELYNPPILTDGFMLETFGRIPPTLTPPPISEEQFEALISSTSQIL